MKCSRAVSAHHAMRRTGGLLCAVAGILLSSCEGLHPDVVRGYTVGEAERAPAETGAEAIPRPVEEAAVTRESRPAAFYQPGTGEFVASPQAVTTVHGRGNITLNFENTNLREVIKVILGDLLSANYSVDPAVQGAVTLQTSEPLSRDDLIPTLELLLRMNGAALVAQNGLYNVVPRDSALRGMLAPQLGNTGQALPRGYSVRIVPLTYVAAEEMQKILEPFTNPGNVVRVDTVRNLLILAGSGPELARLLETVHIFDVDWLKGMSVALFTPDFVDAETLSTELQTVFGEDGESPLSGVIQFVTLERLNALLVITPRPQYLEKVSEWVERLDRDSGGVGQRLYVYRVQNGRASDLATVLSEVFLNQGGAASVPPPELAPGLEALEIASPPRPAAEGEQGAEPAAATPAAFAPASLVGGDGVQITEGAEIRIIADEINNALVILATAQQYKQVEAALHRLDVSPQQVLVETTIAEITLTGELKYGMEWFFTNQIGDKSGQGLLDLSATGAGIGALVPGFSYSIIDKAGAVRAVLNALAEDSRLNVISSPSLMVLNNQTANIDVGEEVPVVTQQQQSTVGTSSPIVNNIEYRNTGVLLAVTPRVNAGGMVVMDVEQEVSQVVSTDTDTTTLTPTISKRSITTSVAVQSGQTVVLGGLIREQKIESRSGIPGLYNLPIIGPLFGATTDNQVRTELVVLITPRAVRNAADAAQVTDEFRSKMESLRPLSHPDDEGADDAGETKTKRAWPRVGPDEKITETKTPEPSVQAPAEGTKAASEALVFEDY